MMVATVAPTKVASEIAPDYFECQSTSIDPVASDGNGDERNLETTPTFARFKIWPQAR